MDETMDQRAITLDHIVFHEFVIEVGMKRLSEAVIGHQQRFVVFLGNLGYSRRAGAAFAVTLAPLLCYGHHCLRSSPPQFF